MNTEKTNYIKNVLEILELRSCENGTLEHKNGKKEKLNFNGKFFVKNLDFNTTNPINSIPLKFNCDYETYSFNVLEKHTTNLLSSRISFCLSTTLDFWKNNILNHVYDEELNQLISKLNGIHGNNVESIISDTIIEKWNEVKKLSKQRSSYNFFIKFNSKMDFAKTTDEKIIGKKPKSKDGEDMIYVYRQVFINELFPFYKLLTNSKSNTIFGITFDKKEIESLKAIFQFIFKDIDKEDDTQYFDRDKDVNTKKIIMVENLSLEYSGLSLLRKFDKLANQIDNCLLKFKDYNEYDVENQMINSNFTNEMFSELVFDMDSSSSDFEKKEVRLEIISQSKFTAEALNKELNEKSVTENIISKKINYKERKAKNFNYPYHRNSREEFPSFSNVLMKSDSSNLISETILLNETLESFNTYVPLEERLRHTYILAGSGSGKTSLLEYLFYQDIQNRLCSKIFFDIMGKSAKRIMQSVDKKDLLLLDFTLKEGFTFKINPFNLKSRKNKEISKKDIAFRTKIIINALEKVLGIEWSTNMKVVLVPCIATLLRKGNSNIFELQRLIQGEKELVDLGKKSPNKWHREFFETQFDDEKLDVTKDAITTKIQALINEDETFLNMVMGEDTIDLEEAINTKGKTIIIKLPKEANLLARLIVEMIQEIVKKRVVDYPEDEIIDTHVYFDEFQNYVTETLEEILTESRNYKLYVTFAHQTLRQIGDKLEDMVLSCTNIQLIGQNSHKNLIKMSKEIQVDIKQLEALKQGEFFLKVGANEAIKIKTTDKFINMEIDEAKHQEHIEYQLEHYYTKIEDENIIEATVVDSKILAPTKSF